MRTDSYMVHAVWTRETIKMKWEEFKKEAERNPFIIMGLLLALLGLWTRNLTFIWMGLGLVWLVLMLTGRKSRAGDEG